MTEIIRYANAPDGVRIAYSDSGQGQTLFHLPAFPRSHLELELQEPKRRHFYKCLAANHRLVRFDHRGIGLSDKEIENLSMEALVSDIIAVADELGIDDFAILASGISASIVIRLAILYEDRVSHLVLWDPLIQRSASEPAVEALTSILDENWGLFLETRYRIMMSAEEAHQAAELVRSSVSPEYFRRARRLWSDFDRTSDLGKVTCPTLVMHPYDREESRESSEFIASSIAGAKLAVVDDNSAEIFNCDAAAILTTIAEFIGVPESNYPSLQNREALGGENGGRMTPELTNRETEIVTLLAEGLRSKEIGGRLKLSTHTVERHIANLYHKTGANGRVALTVFAMKNGLLANSDK